MSRHHPKSSPDRVHVSALAPARPSTLAGRLVAAGAEGEGLALRDATGEVELVGEVGAVGPGDLVEVAGEVAGGRLVVASCRLLVRSDRSVGPPRVPKASALKARAAMMGAVRGYFEGAGFLEVETPNLVPTPGTDVYLEAFETRFSGLGEFGDQALYLHTSPEFAMKQMLAAGLERIVQVCKCYRDGELTSRHNPEFTMVEWYRAYADYEPIMADVEAVVRAALGDGVLRWRGAEVDLSGPFERLTVQEAFRRHCGGLDVLTLDTAESLRGAAEAAGLGPLVPGGGWDDVFHELLITHVEPNLGLSRPTFLLDYPAPLAVLARRRDDDPRVAERFELYIAGVELCNGFSELNDPVEQRARFEEDLARRAAMGLPPYPTPEGLLDALRWGMPPSGGVALGLDRLLMLKVDTGEIDDVVMRAVRRR